jgi:hypothetical protein
MNTKRSKRIGRLAAMVLVALAGIVTMAAVAPARTAAATYPPHLLEKVWCGGGGNSGPDWNFIQPYVPQIYAYNTKPGVVEYQNVAYRFRLYRLVNNQWIVDPERGNWTAWTGFRTMDLDYPGRWLGGTYTAPSTTKIFVPRLYQMYAIAFQPAWQNASTGAWTYGPATWSQTHLNLIGGGYSISDRDMGFFGCDYYPEFGTIPMTL